MTRRDSRLTQAAILRRMVQNGLIQRRHEHVFFRGHRYDRG